MYLHCTCLLVYIIIDIATKLIYISNSSLAYSRLHQILTVTRYKKYAYAAENNEITAIYRGGRHPPGMFCHVASIVPLALGGARG